MVHLKDAYPLSPMQSGLFFHSLFAPESEAYFVQFIFELQGKIDALTLKDAWQKISDHHPMLRTGFGGQNETLFQYVLESIKVPFQAIDWQGLSKQEQEQRLKSFLQEDRKKGVNLRSAPLFRVCLIHYETDKYDLIWSQHHILFDGWCLPILLRDLFQTYSDITSNRTIRYKTQRPYRDYIAWLQQQDVNQAELFWKNYLSPLEEPTKVSFKEIIKSNKNNDYETYAVTLSIEETEVIKKFAAQNCLTLNTVIQGAVGVVLKTYTQQKEIVLGITVSGRTIDLPGIEEMVGLFINTLPLRISYQSGDTTLAFLQSLQEQNQKLNEYAYVSLAQIQSWSPLDQSLFDVIFVFENYPLHENVLPIETEFQIQGIRGFEKTEYPLSIIVRPGKQLVFSFGYQTEHYSEELIARFSEHIKQVLQNFVSNIEDFLQNRSILSLQENQLFIEWNNTKADYPKDKCVYELFEDVAKAYPDHIALVYEEQTLTYQQLNDKANQLAHYLVSLGISHDTFVAIAMERSLEMVIGILAILKAGGAYVPLDPTYPIERLQFMLQDTRAPILLTDPSLKTLFNNYSGKIVTFNLNDNILHYQPITSPEVHTISSHIAYVIYTSGSTGKPKGVMIEHHSLINRLIWMQDKYQLTSRDCVAQKTPFTFDVSVWEFFWPLIVGATEVIAPLHIHKDPYLFLQFIKKNKISVCHFVPSMLDNFLNETKFDQLSLRLTIASGEALSQDLVKKCHAKLNTSLNNLYGPTEATIDVTYYECLDDDSSPVPIGRPIANIKTHILDSYFNPVPIGIIGELYLGGVGLARGYLNRPDLTAEKFIPNPFYYHEPNQDLHNLRLYRTGDLARYLPDGNIEFLGRIDHQVKIRGFRIELGEIESTLNKHSNIVQSVVLERETTSGSKGLVAYLVTNEVTISSEELIDYLSLTLPDHMIPSFFVFLDKIPLTSNGKIDRRALPTLNASVRHEHNAYALPQTATEQQLASIWSAVLKIEKIGIFDHFFKIGGHSLLATQIISRIRQNYNIDIPLRTIFDNPTIAGLSTLVDSLRNEQHRSLIPPIIAKQRQDEAIPLSFAQQRLWFLDTLLPNMAIYNIPIALSLTGSLDKRCLENAFTSLIQRHESLRTCFPTVHGKARQQILSNLHVDVSQSYLDLEQINKNEQALIVEKIAHQEANTPFDLSIGPLMRVKLVTLSKEEHILFVTFHHIISDAWSLKIFFKELSILYQSYTQGKHPALPSLSIQYADFTLWQREWLQGKILEQQLAYWKQQLNGTPDLIELPTNQRRPEELSYQGASFQTTLSKEITTRLNQLAQEQKTTLFMTLLAIFKVLCHRYSGQKDIVIGSPIANRHHKETENIIGLFVNTLVLRTRFEHNHTFIDLLKQVRETVFQAYQHQDVPFEQLVDHLNIPRHLNHNPLFQVMFSFQNAETDASLILENLLVKPLDLSYPVAKFDLSFHGFEDEKGINFSIEYATDLFEMNTIKSMASHFKELVLAIINNPEHPIETYSILSTKEKHQMLIEWNDTKADYPKNRCVHNIFEAIVDSYPYRTAIVFEEKALSYQQLNHQANQLAHHLRSCGVGTETFVAIAVERSLEMVIGILAILKAGGAYIPLDPTYPLERLKFILQDTQASFLLTDSSLKPLFNDYQGSIISFDQDENFFQQQPITNPISITSPYHLAYVIYTSGSTGKPKGVQIIHQGLVSFLTDMKDRLGITKDAILLSATSMLFDIFGLELYLPLAVGAKLILVPQHSSRDGEALLKLIQQEHVTMMQATSTTWHMLLELGWKAKSDFKILHGGEALSQKLYTSFQSMSVPCWNLYGPTETTIWSTALNIKECAHKNHSLIGMPIGNTQIYVLDNNLNPVPIGVTGEIYIGGVGLARGYLHRPDMTADRFIPNPFFQHDTYQDHNLRLYRTGDLGRYILSGEIEFLGRIDHQIKIRGFRIELEEIESVLNQHPHVSQAVVITKESESGNQRLVAYLVLKDRHHSSLSSEDLTHYLSRVLPDYMIPTFFVFLDQMLLTPNGKIDRLAFPTPDINFKSLIDGYVAPHTACEIELASIWKELLKIKRVGIHDNFFNLGGDSIISIQLVGKARLKGILFTVKDVFKYPTISSLAATAKIEENSLNTKPDSTISPSAFSLVDSDQVKLVHLLLIED